MACANCSSKSVVSGLCADCAKKAKDAAAKSLTQKRENGQDKNKKKKK